MNEEHAAGAHQPGPFETFGRKLDERPEVQAAADAVRRAKEQLHKAQEQYEALRHETSEGIKHLREQNVGDLAECTLELVRKHPGAGVAVAGLLGFFLGRLFRR